MERIIKIDNIPYSLQFKMKVEQERDKYYYTLDCLFPDDYPSTKFFQHLITRNEGYFRPKNCVGQCKIAVNGRDYCDSFKDFGEKKQFLPWNSRRKEQEYKMKGRFISWLSGLYSFSAGHYDITLPEERSALKGLGKTLLCLTCKQIEQDKRIKLDDWLMGEADGSILSEQEFNKQIAELKLQNFPELWLQTAKEYPAIVLQYLMVKEPSIDIEQDEDFLIFVVKGRNNKKLIEYYEKTYGFELMEKSATQPALIGVEISTLLNYCRR